jgi:hypothetical protein
MQDKSLLRMKIFFAWPPERPRQGGQFLGAALA